MGYPNRFIFERVLTNQNVDTQIDLYLKSVGSIGDSVGDLRGIALLHSLKRTTTGTGPYPHVSLFEAANRIMTDLVLLYGVRWLLKSRTLPFSSFTVEYGNEDNNGFDVTAEENGARLIGEAFNVAPSFFQTKKAKMLQKMRNAASPAEHFVLLFNHDALPVGYTPSKTAREHFVAVHVDEGNATLLTRNAPEEVRPL